MLTIQTGLPGAGKTLHTLVYVKALAERENRPVYYHGIKDLKLPWIQLEKPEEWYSLPPGSIVVIDEAQQFFRPRGNGTTVPRHVSELETHRHAGIDLFLITQHPMLIDSNARRLCGKHFHSVRFFGFNKSTIHEFQEIREQCDKNRAGSIRHDFVYPKDAFHWYKSAEVHTHKAKLPARVWFLMASPILLAGIAYLAYSSFMKNLEPKVVPSQIAQVSSAAPTGSSRARETRQSSTMTDEQWLAVQRPRIVGLPHTAPIYDGLSSVARMPIPAACLMMNNRCECYTEQGTKLASVQETICKEIVTNGWFNPYRQNENVKGGVPLESKPHVVGSLT